VAGAAAMKQRDLRPATPLKSKWFARPSIPWWFEFDEHGADIVWTLPDGRVYRSSGILETPVRDDLRRPLEDRA
jgi:hypothetical protein